MFFLFNKVEIHSIHSWRFQLHDYQKFFFCEKIKVLLFISLDFINWMHCMWDSPLMSLVLENRNWKNMRGWMGSWRSASINIMVIEMDSGNQSQWSTEVWVDSFDIRSISNSREGVSFSDKHSIGYRLGISTRLCGGHFFFLKTSFSAFS